MRLPLWMSLVLQVVFIGAPIISIPYLMNGNPIAPVIIIMGVLAALRNAPIIKANSAILRGETRRKP